MKIPAMCWSRWWLVAGLVAVSLSMALSAHAQSDAAGAEYLFREGREAMERGETALACEKFAASYQLDPAAGTMINLAACFEAQQMTASAWEAWQRALARLPADDERIPGVRQRLAEAETHLSRLTIRLAPGAPAGTVVEKHGAALAPAALGAALPTDPGAVTITVRAPGRAPRDFRVVVELEGSASVVVEPGAALPEKPAPPVAEPVGESRRRTSPGRALKRTGLVLGGVGLVGLAAGATAGGVAMTDQGTMDQECLRTESGLYCSAAGLEASDRGDVAARASTIAFAAGGAVLVGGTFLYAAGRHRARAEVGFLPTTERVSILVSVRY